MLTLIAIDNSEASATIVEAIAARPWAKEARFEIVHVTEPAHLWTLSTTAEELAVRSKTTVDRAVEALTRRGLTVEGVQLEGDPKTKILDRAAEVRAARIVLGSRGASGTDRLLLGSVASAVLRNAECSVWVLRTSGDALPQKVLLATDGSEGSEIAARSLTMHPLPAATAMRVFSVVEYYLPPEVTLFQPPGVDPTRVNQIREQALSTAEDAVDSGVRILSTTYKDVSGSISVLLDRPGDLILKEAESWGADWITMGSHGRRGMQRFLIGSVSEYVATHAKCSVAVER